MNNFNITITPFDGDPSQFSFFKEQIEAVININKYTDEKALLFVKSNLAGAARKYYIDAPDLREVKTASELLNALKEFFVPSVNSYSIADLNKIVMLPGENIQSLEHRIRKVTHAVYPSINDKAALQQIMLTTLMSALPSQVKVKIIEQNCSSFDDAVKLAKVLFEKYARNNILNFLVDTDKSNVAEDISHLKTEINHLKQNTNEHYRPNNQIQDRLKSPRRKNFARKNSPIKKNQSHRFKFKARPQFRHKSWCEFCKRSGHNINFCFKKKNLEAKRHMTHRNNTQNTSSNTHHINHMHHESSSTCSQNNCNIHKPSSHSVQPSAHCCSCQCSSTSSFLPIHPNLH